MAIEALYVMRQQTPRSAHNDLDRVALTADVISDDGDTITAGSEGTVVGVWREGGAYEVEFTAPVAGLATALPGALRRLDERSWRIRAGHRQPSRSARRRSSATS